MKKLIIFLIFLFNQSFTQQYYSDKIRQQLSDFYNSVEIGKVIKLGEDETIILPEGKGTQVFLQSDPLLLTSDKELSKEDIQSQVGKQAISPQIDEQILNYIDPLRNLPASNSSIPLLQTTNTQQIKTSYQTSNQAKTTGTKLSSSDPYYQYYVEESPEAIEDKKKRQEESTLKLQAQKKQEAEKLDKYQILAEKQIQLEAAKQQQEELLLLSEKPAQAQQNVEKETQYILIEDIPEEVKKQQAPKQEEKVAAKPAPYEDYYQKQVLEERLTELIQKALEKATTDFRKTYGNKQLN